MPGIGHGSAIRLAGVAPGKLGAVEPAARGELPLGLGRQLLAGPRRVGLGVAIGDVDHGMVVEPLVGAARPIRMPPVGAEAEGPPVRPIGEVDRPLRFLEHQRASAQHVRKSAGIVLSVRRNLGEGDMSGLFDEAAELGIGHRRRVHKEAVDLDAMGRLLFGIMMVRAHGELAALDEDHLGLRSRP